MMLWDALGMIGVTCFLLAYFFLQNGRWHPHQPPYLATNLAGALLVMISLIFDWNLPAFLLELMWAFISMWGLFKYHRAHRPK